jgi:hypothetical protein
MLDEKVGGTILGGLAGAAALAPAVTAATVSAGAGHGGYVAARLLFPFTMLLAQLSGTIGPVAIAVGLIQLPLQGAVIGRTAALGSYRPALLVIASHLVAVLVCFSDAFGTF